MKVYSVDVRVYATAYIKARSAKEALRLARTLADTSPDILDSEGWVPVTGLQYDDPDLPSISLSPAMTIHGPDDDARAFLVYEGPAQ